MEIVIPKNSVFNRSTCAFVVSHKRELPIILNKIDFSKISQ